MNKKKRAGDRENNFFFLFFSGNIRLGKFDNCLLGGGGSGGGGGGGRQVLAARIKAEQCEGGGGIRLLAENHFPLPRAESRIHSRFSQNFPDNYSHRPAARKDELP
jgi:hypothetical protein